MATLGLPRPSSGAAARRHGPSPGRGQHVIQREGVGERRKDIVR